MFDYLMSYLLSDVCAREDVVVTLSRIIVLLVGIVIRIIYLELFSEFFAAFKYLIFLCVASSMIVS